jgi:pilus assembly protein Flp/PilA
MKLEALTSIFSDESGATAIEYGLIAGLVSVVAIGALSATGDTLISIFNKVSGELAKAAQ